MQVTKCAAVKQGFQQFILWNVYRNQEWALSESSQASVSKRGYGRSHHRHLNDFFYSQANEIIITRKGFPLASFESGALSIEHGIGLLFQTQSLRDCMFSISIHLTPSSTGFPKTQWGTRDSRASGGKREEREGDDGNERRPRAGSDGKVNQRKGLFSPSHHSVRLSFPFKLTQLSPKKVIASHWGRGSSS